MNIHLQDLGPKWQTALLQRRAAFPTVGSLLSGTDQIHRTDGLVLKRVGLLGRWWTGGLSLSSEAAKAVLAAMSRAGYIRLMVVLSSATMAVTVTVGSGIGYADHHPVGALAFAAFGTAMAGLWLACPKAEVRGIIRKPVTHDEISALRSATPDPLERSYFALLQELQQQTPNADTAPQLRGAVRALGQALSQMPPHGAAANIEALRGSAAQKQEEAGAETDEVIAASMERQAEALRRSADIAERSARLMRRTAVLRDELSAQTESLRLGLDSSQAHTGDVSGLSDLAEAVQSVAVQAAALTDARSELDAALEGPSSVAMKPPSAPQMLRAGEN